MPAHAVIDKLPDEVRWELLWTKFGPFSARKVQSMSTSRGEAWNCILTKDGKDIAMVENRGDGGADWWHPEPGVDLNAVKDELVAAALEAGLPASRMHEFGKGQTFEHKTSPGVCVIQLTIGVQERTKWKRDAKTHIFYSDGEVIRIIKEDPTPAAIAAVEGEGYTVLNDYIAGL